jgi:hypothetical protein
MAMLDRDQFTIYQMRNSIMAELSRANPEMLVIILNLLHPEWQIESIGKRDDISGLAPEIVPVFKIISKNG